MDWINKVHVITEKMKNQLFAKQIDSLDKIFVAISKFDHSNIGYVEKILFENFLAKIGIFLKTQELNELHKYLYTAENGNTVSFEHFINLFKSEVPEKITNSIVQIFNSLQEGNNKISLDTVRKSLNLDHHPRIKLMLKSTDSLVAEFEFSLMFVSGNKGYLDLNDFLEFHRNIYWVTPKDNLTNFYVMTCNLWGYKNF